MKTSSFISLFEKAARTIKESAEILIVSPNPPDADSISSGLLIHEYFALPWVNKPHTLFCAGQMPSVNRNPLFKFFGGDLALFKNSLPPVIPPVAVISDYGNFRTCGLEPEKFKKTCQFIGFDHHAEPADDFPEGGIQIVDPDASSTTVLLYHFFGFIGVPISRRMATYIALGILTDTGRLTNPKTNSDALRVLLSCIDKGAPWEEMRSLLQPRISQKTPSVWASASREIVFRGYGEFSILIAGHKALSSWGGTRKDAESFLGVMQNIEGVRVAVLALEEDGAWKISIRSNIPQEVSATLMAKTLGGGGHPHMAAAIFTGHPLEAVEILQKELERQKKQNRRT